MKIPSVTERTTIPKMMLPHNTRLVTEAIHKLVRDTYLSIIDQRDVIEVPINDVLDINGWELRKALRLFRKSNAPIYEWLQSPIVYCEEASFSESMRMLMPEYFSMRAGMHHYLSMTKGVFENELSGETVRLKKYFYALRPILAAIWIADIKSVPPMRFAELRKLLPSHVHNVVDKILAKKATVDESFMIDRQDALHDFISESIRYCQSVVPDNMEPGDLTQLDRLFKKYVV